MGYAITHNPLNLLVRPAGFEPATYGFEDRGPELSNLLKSLQLIEITYFPFSRSFPILVDFSRFWKLFLTQSLTQQIGCRRNLACFTYWDLRHSIKDIDLTFDRNYMFRATTFDFLHRHQE